MNIHSDNYYKRHNQTYYVYIITNTITGRKYYGSTKVNLRWGAHKNIATIGDKANPRAYYRPLYVDMREYGIENFTFDRLDGDYSTKALARVKEYKLILSDRSCYNISAVCGSMCRRPDNRWWVGINLLNKKYSTTKSSKESAEQWLVEKRKQLGLT